LGFKRLEIDIFCRFLIAHYYSGTADTKTDILRQSYSTKIIASVYDIPVHPGEGIKRSGLSVKKLYNLSSFLTLLLLLAFLFLSSGTSKAQTSYTYTTSGTFTVPAGVISVTVECWGGGGGGSTITTTGRRGGGGGGGAFASGVVTVIPGNSYSVVVGTGGNANTAGNNSTFNGTNVVADAGDGAQPNSQTPGPGGTVAASAGTIRYAGGSGATGGGTYSGGGGGCAGTTGPGGNAPVAAAGSFGPGTSLNGGNGGASVSGSANGNGGNTYGGGGSGACTNSFTDRTGGSGANGLVVVTWTCPVYNMTGISATDACIATGTSTVTLTGIPSELPLGIYTVTYDRSLPAMTGLTAIMTVAVGGSGTFTATGLTTVGNSTITITNLSSGPPGTCSSAISGVGNSFTISVGTTPVQPSTITGPTNPCQGSTQTYSVTNVSNVIYTWTFPAGWTQTGGGTTNSVTVTVGANAGNIQVTPSNSCGNGTSRTLAVTPILLPAQPSAITGSTAPCEGTTQTYNVTNVGGVTYNWAFPVGWAQTGGGTTNSVTVTVGSGSGNITVTPSNACGNGTARTLAVTVSTSPVITVQPVAPAPTCSGSGVQTLTVTATGTGLTYSWRRNGVAVVNGGVIAGQGTATLTLTNPTAANAGNYDVVISGTCTPSVTSIVVVVTINAIPQGTLSGSTVCAGGTGQFTFTSTSGTGPFTLIINGLTYPGVVNGTPFNANPNPGATTNYTLTSITDANGCVRTSGITDPTATITVRPLPQGSLAGDIICPSENGQFTFTSTSGTGPFTLIIDGVSYSGINSGTPFNANPNPLLTTVYTLTSITDANSCVRTSGITGSSATITVRLSPAITVQPVTPAPTCSGTGLQTITVTAAGTGLTYSWRRNGVAVVNGGVIAGQGTATLTLTNPTAANAGNYDVVISGTCTPSVTSVVVVVTINSIPQGTLTSNTVCSGSPGQFTFTSTSGTGPFTLIINGITYPGVVSGTPFNANPNPGATTNYTLTSITDANGCVRTSGITDPTATITVRPLPQGSLSGDVICPGDNGQLTFTSTSGTGPFTLIIDGVSFAGVVSGVAFNANPNPVVTTTVTLTSITDANSCVRTTGISGPSATITVKPAPDPSIMAEYCTGLGAIRLTAIPTTGLTYLWNTGETINPILVTVAGIYSVTATNGVGCSATAYLSVATELVTDGSFTNFNAAFPAFITSYTQNQAYYTGVPTSGLWPEGYYAVNTSAWSNSPGLPNGYHTLFHGRDHTNNSTGPRNFMMVNGIINPFQTIWQQTVTVLPNTDYYFSAWGMNLNPASPARLSFEVNGAQVGTIADLNIAPKPTTEAQVGLTNWVRFYSNPTWNSGAATTAVIRIINLNTDPGGNDFGLDDISFGTLAPIPSVISPIANSGNPICDGDTLQLSANVTGGIPPIYYSWVGPNGFTSNIANPYIFPASPVNAGTYTVSVTDGNNCPPIDVSTTAVIHLRPTITPGANPVVCRGITSANLSYSATTEAPDQYSIDYNAAANAAGFIDVTNAALGASPIVLTVPALAAPGVYNGTLTVRVSATGCISDAHPITVTILARPVPTITGPANICAGNTGIVYSTEAAMTGYTWTVTPGGNITAGWNTNSITVTWNTSGAQTVTVTYTGANGCDAALPTSYAVTVNANPTAIITGTNAFCSGTNTVLSAAGSTAGSGSITGYQWNLAGVPIPLATAVTYTVTVPGSYTVTVTNSNGCFTTSAATVVTENSVPTITLGPNPGVCRGTTAANLSYSATTGATNQYSIDYDPAANAAGFTDVVNAALPGSPIVLVVPAAAPAASYSAVLTVRSSVTGCVSINYPIMVIVSPPIINNNIQLITVCATSTSSAQVLIVQGIPGPLSGGNGTFTYSWEFSTPGSSNFLPIPGETGATLTLNQTANNGFYRRIVTSGGCTSTSNQIHVNINNAVGANSFNVTGGGSYCIGGAGVPVGLSGSVPVAVGDEYTVTYNLLLNGVYTGISLPGTGSPLNFGNQTVAGVYTVEAVVNVVSGSPCAAVLCIGSVTVSINPLPLVFSVTGGGSYCSGGAGVPVGLSGSESGVNYQLLINGVNSGIPVPGTGGAITFGNQTAAGTYTVTATNATTGCFNNMTGSVTVTILPLPVPILIYHD
jgi:hypothetical protein